MCPVSPYFLILSPLRYTCEAIFHISKIQLVVKQTIYGIAQM